MTETNPISAAVAAVEAGMNMAKASELYGVSYGYLRQKVAKVRKLAPSQSSSPNPNSAPITSRVTELEAEVAELKTEIGGLNADLTRAERDYDDMLSRFQVAEAERNDLAERLAALKPRKPLPPSSPLTQASPTPSTFSNSTQPQSQSLGQLQQAVNHATIAYRQALPGPDKEQAKAKVRQLEKELGEAIDAAEACGGLPDVDSDPDNGENPAPVIDLGIEIATEIVNEIDPDTAMGSGVVGSLDGVV